MYIIQLHPSIEPTVNLTLHYGHGIKIDGGHRIKIEGPGLRSCWNQLTYTTDAEKKWQQQ